MVQITSRLAVGGLAPFVLALCERLNPSSFDCTLLTGNVGEDEGNMLDLQPPSRARIITIPELGRAVAPAADLVAFRKVHAALRSLRADVVHTHAAKGGALGRPAAVLAGVPARIHSFHGHVFRGYFSPAVSRAVQLTERALGLFTDAITAPSAPVLEELTTTYHIMPPSKGRVIPHGIDLSAFAHLPDRATARTMLGVPQDSFVIGMVGRIVPVKNHRLMVSALRRLLRERLVPAPHLLVVGCGESRPDIEAAVDGWGLSNSVTFAGVQKDLAPVYAAMDVLALTSNTEGVPTSILEAMACGVPVVATAVGGVTGVITERKTGLLVPANDDERLAAAISEVMRSGELRQTCKSAGRALVEGSYSLDATIRITGQLYEEVLARRPRRAGPR